MAVLLAKRIAALMASVLVVCVICLRSERSMVKTTVEAEGGSAATTAATANHPFNHTTVARETEETVSSVKQPHDDNITREGDVQAAPLTSNATTKASDAYDDSTTVTTPQSTAVHSPNDAAPPVTLNFCRQLHLQLPKPQDNTTVKFRVDYYCNGTNYDNFTSLVRRFVQNETLHPNRLWGQRAVALPRNASVLFLGNSHTKQIFETYLCQYSAQVTQFRRYHKKAYSITFRNNASLYLVYNSPVEMAVDWQAQLQKLVHRPLSSWSAIVLGQFNGAGKDLKNTNYYKEMMNWSLSDKNLQFGKVEPPDVIRLSRAFDGPIVFASSFDIKKAPAAQKVISVLHDLERLHNRTNLRAINSRTYLPALDGHECGTDDRLGVGWCGPKWAASHRCTGAHGGLVDLAVFDVQAALFGLLTTKAPATKT